MPEPTEPKEQSASDVLLAAMSRSDIYSPQFLAFLNRRGVYAETLLGTREDVKREAAYALASTIIWPSDDLVSDEMVKRVAAQRTPSQVFGESELTEWALDNGFTDE